jgi:chemosensory pili system protein ChpA (sensor histidine kinase/response regulator)
LKHVPIIMITSRMADKHRAYAKEIGVNHYLGKPFQEDELLSLLSSYIHPEVAAESA